MNTIPIYLTDSYQTAMDAQILEVIPEGTGKYRILLSQTVFYPMGGGQPTDQGHLASANWNADVYQVMMKDGEIWHYMNSTVEPKIGENVHGEINWDRRYKNMKVHSAGHIVDFALFLLGLTPDILTPLKGDHGKKPYIIYVGTVSEDIQTKLQQTVNELITKDLKFSWRFMPSEELQEKAIYLQPGLPTNKPLRSLTLETVGTVADGGTQLHSTGEVGNISIDSVTTEGENTLIKYSIA